MAWHYHPLMLYSRCCRNEDLAVVVLLILIPLISPNSSKGGNDISFEDYEKTMLEFNAFFFEIETLFHWMAALDFLHLAIRSFLILSSLAGLSMALGAFLAELLLAETEFSLQVESDIAPYRGLLLGLFFMTVGRLH
ncbi:hypothetical protein I3760_01G048500 [Carya illinoinensis]|nr:hypothetical protein I3760_01G048500 [Carya illinoinensis]